MFLRNSFTLFRISFSFRDGRYKRKSASFVSTVLVFPKAESQETRGSRGKQSPLFPMGPAFKGVVFLNTDSITHLPVLLKIINISCVVMIDDTYLMTVTGELLCILWILNS